MMVTWINFGWQFLKCQGFWELDVFHLFQVRQQCSRIFKKYRPLTYLELEHILVFLHKG